MDTLSFLGSMQWIIKQLWDKGLLYRGYKALHPGCRDCGPRLKGHRRQGWGYTGPGVLRLQDTFTLGLGNRVQGRKEGMLWAAKLL